MLFYSCASNSKKDTKMHTKSYGSGSKTLILINGGPSLSNYISTLGVQLSSKYKIVEYYQKGSPENPAKNKDELTLRAHLSDLKTVVEDCKGSQIILVGHSWGASLALMYLSQNPGVISKTILIGSAPLNDEAAKKFGENIQSRLSDESKAKLQSIKSEFDHAASDEERNTLMQKRLAIIGPAYHMDPKTEENFSDLKWNFTTFLTSIDSLWDFIDGGNVVRALDKISDPVIAFHGNFDPIPIEETFTFLKTYIKGLKTIEVKNSGHFPWLEKKASIAFMKDLKSEIDGLK
jgi:pimeloyl-ACP methyl ester carboxylesterase